MNGIDATIIIAYLLAMVGVGVWFMRRNKSAEDYFRGGGRLPLWGWPAVLFWPGADLRMTRYGYVHPLTGRIRGMKFKRVLTVLAAAAVVVRPSAQDA